MLGGFSYSIPSRTSISSTFPVSPVSFTSAARSLDGTLSVNVPSPSPSIFTVWIVAEKDVIELLASCL